MSVQELLIASAVLKNNNLKSFMLPQTNMFGGIFYWLLTKKQKQIPEKPGILSVHYGIIWENNTCVVTNLWL